MKSPKLYLRVKEIDNRRFYYIDYGQETHGRNTYRLWVHHSLVQADNNGNYYIELPIAAKVEEGKKPCTLILRPSTDYWVTEVYVECGYRGSSDFKIKEQDQVVVYPYCVYRSPRGSLGISRGALVQVPNTLDSITVEWKRTGRLYGEPANGVTIVYKDGRIAEFEGTSLEDLEEIEELGEPEKLGDPGEPSEKNRSKRPRRRN